MIVGRDNLQWHPRRVRDSPWAVDNLTLFASRFPPEYMVKQTVLTRMRKNLPPSARVEAVRRLGWRLGPGIKAGGTAAGGAGPKPVQTTEGGD